MSKKTSSGIKLKKFYGSKYNEKPGDYPFTHGIYPEMYLNKKWTMRQYAGFSTAKESNKRYKYLLKQGVSGLSVAFDLPTQTGYDSDHSLAVGEIGKVGVPISTIEDMKKIVDKAIPEKAIDERDEYYEENNETNNLNEPSIFEDDSEIIDDETYDNILGQPSEDRSDKSTLVQSKISPQKFYTVQITSGKDLNAAESLVLEAKLKGIDSYIQKGYVDKSGLLWYRVRSGKYQSIDDAQSASIQINEIMNTNSWVDNFLSNELTKEELIPSISGSIESLPLFNVIDPWMKENIINYSSIKYIKWYDPYIRGTFHLQRVQFSILSNQQELIIDEREFKFWDGKLYSVFDNQGRQLQ